MSLQKRLQIMSETGRQPSRWMGKAILAISILHTIFAFVAFRGPFLEILADGFFNAIGPDPMRAASAWFFFAGMFMASTGIAVYLFEKHGLSNELKPLGIFLLLATVLGIVMMPVSGFWLLLVPAIAMIWNDRRPAA